MDVRLRVLVDPALVAAVLGRVDGDEPRDPAPARELAGGRGDEPVVRVHEVEPAAELRARGEHVLVHVVDPGDERVEVVLRELGLAHAVHVHAVALLVRGQAPAAARDDVHLVPVAHQLLGELAHVAREATLHDRRVLPREGQDAHADAQSMATGEVPEHPFRRQRLAAVGAAVDEHVVARAQVHRQVALDRIPVVVLADQLVELVEAGALGELRPALGEQLGVAVALLADRAVGPREPALLVGDRVVDLGDPLHPARLDAGLQVGLDRALRHASAAGDRLAQPRRLVEILLDQAFRGTAIHRGSLYERGGTRTAP